MTGSWSSASRARRRPKAASSSRIQPRRSLRKGRSSVWVPVDVKAGDRILFGKWSGTEVKIDGEDLIIMKESDILGVVD
jgi:co-chaperonin GroES (HSP10)